MPQVTSRASSRSTTSSAAARTAISEPTRSSIRCATCRFDGPGPPDRETLLDHVPAVDHERVARYERRVRTAEPHGRCRDFFGLSEPFERMQVRDGFPL